MNELEKNLKTLANKRRLAILKYIKENKEAAVGEIAEAIKLSFKATSRHLNLLSAVNIVEKDQRGLNMFYRMLHNKHPAVKYIISLL